MKLSLCYNGIGPQGALALAKAFNNIVLLKKLILTMSNNKIADVGSSGIATTLKKL